MTSTPASTNELIYQARQAVEAGDRLRARRLLQQAAGQDPEDYRIWLWLASVAPTAQACLQYVQRAEQLNPGHPRVIALRAWAEKQQHQATAGPPPENAPQKIPTAVVSITLALLVALLVTAGVYLTWDRSQAAGDAPAQLAAAPQLPPLAASLPDGAGTASMGNPAPPAATATQTPTPHVPAKQMAANYTGLPRPTWTVTPTPTPTPTPTATWVPTHVSPGGKEYTTRPFGVGPEEKWIDVNLSTQTLVAFVGSTPVFETLISSGTSEHPTVTGQFRIWLTYESQTMDGTLLGYDYYLENVPYVMYFYHDYALHGTFWHSNFGTPMSHGCVNMRTSDAGWVYNWAPVGTLVNVHN